MLLPHDQAMRFIEAYKAALLEVLAMEHIEQTGSVIENLAKARDLVAKAPDLLDGAIKRTQTRAFKLNQMFFWQSALCAYLTGFFYDRTEFRPYSSTRQFRIHTRSRHSPLHLTRLSALCLVFLKLESSPSSGTTFATASSKTSSASDPDTGLNSTRPTPKYVRRVVTMAKPTR